LPAKRLRNAKQRQINRRGQQSYSITVDNIRDFNVKMIDMAQANAEAVFEFARQSRPQSNRLT
jgi:hypothetical protein